MLPDDITRPQWVDIFANIIKIYSKYFNILMQHHLIESQLPLLSESPIQAVWSKKLFAILVGRRMALYLGL